METTMTKFEPSSIELVITGAIARNTLPQAKVELDNWLNQFNVANLETDEDFAAAAKLVTVCSKTEERIADIKEKSLSGDVRDAIHMLDDMRESVRAKRLEFEHAVKDRKEEIKAKAIKQATKRLESSLTDLDYRRPVDIETALRAAIKGTRTLDGLQEALAKEANYVLLTERGYSEKFAALRGEVMKMFASAEETASEDEVTALVKANYEAAPGMVPGIIQQRREARERAAQAMKPVLAQATPPAQVPPQLAAATAQAASTGWDDVTITEYRVGVTFRSTQRQQANIMTILRTQGGKDIKVVPL